MIRENKHGTYLLCLMVYIFQNYEEPYHFIECRVDDFHVLKERWRRENISVNLLSEIHLTFIFLWLLGLEPSMVPLRTFFEWI